MSEEIELLQEAFDFLSKPEEMVDENVRHNILLSIHDYLSEHEKDSKKWHERIDKDIRSDLNMLAGALNLDELDKYLNQHHFLNSVYSRVIEAKSLVSQASNILGR